MSVGYRFKQVASDGDRCLHLLVEIRLVDLIVGIADGVIVWIPIVDMIIITMIILYLDCSCDTILPEWSFIPSATPG